jgi:hypothetical protein
MARFPVLLVLLCCFQFMENVRFYRESPYWPLDVSANIDDTA